MNKTVLSFVFYAICLLFIKEGAYAEQAMTLDEAISAALKGNPAIVAAEKGLSAARQDPAIAQSSLLPRLTFEERYMRTDNPTYSFSAKLNQGRFGMSDFAIDRLNNPDAVNDYQTSVSLEQPVYVKKAYIGIDMAKTEASAKAYELKRKKEQVALDVTRAYLGVQVAKAYVQAAEAALKDATEHKRIVDARLEAGLGLHSDKLRAEVAVKNAEEMLIKAEKNLKVAKRALGLMLGLEEPIDAVGDIEAGSVPDIDSLMSHALKRADVSALEERLKNARNAVKLAESDYLPMLGVGGNYQWNDHNTAFGSEGKSYMVMAFLRWNIFDGLKREHERTKAKLQSQEVAEYLEGLKKEISFRVYEAYLSVDEARNSLELSKARLTAAEEAVRLIRVRYENSMSTLVELLDAQTSLDAARAGVVEKNSAYLAAEAELRYVSGTILDK